VDKSLAQKALNEPQVKRLMTITGVNATVAMSVLAAIGDIHRFSSPEKLVSYFGLNPRVRQSGDKPAYHGRIIDHAEQHQGRLAPAFFGPERRLHMLQVRWRHVELPELVRSTGLKSDRRARLDNPPMIIAGLAHEAVDRGASEASLRGLDQAIRGLDAMILEQLYCSLRRDLPALLVTGAYLQRRDDFGIALHLRVPLLKGT
jgi:hypothetical protein